MIAPLQAHITQITKELEFTLTFTQNNISRITETQYMYQEIYSSLRIKKFHSPRTQVMLYGVQ